MFHFCFFNYKMSGFLNYLVWYLSSFDLYGMSLSPKKDYFVSKFSLPILTEPIAGDLDFIFRYVGEWF